MNVFPTTHRSRSSNDSFPKRKFSFSFSFNFLYPLSLVDSEVWLSRQHITHLMMVQSARLKTTWRPSRWHRRLSRNNTINRYTLTLGMILSILTTLLRLSTIVSEQCHLDNVHCWTRVYPNKSWPTLEKAANLRRNPSTNLTVLSTWKDGWYDCPKYMIKLLMMMMMWSTLKARSS